MSCDPGGRCLEACLQTGYKTPLRLVEQKHLFGEQGSAMVGKVCLSEDMLDVYVSWLGELLDSCPEASSSPVTTFATHICGHTGTHTIH